MAETYRRSSRSPIQTRPRSSASLSKSSPPKRWAWEGVSGSQSWRAGLFRGAPVEGWIGYRGFVIGNPEQPIGTFFVGPPGNSKLNFGLAGLVPAARRTRRALAAAVAVARALRNLGARALQFEIDRRNLGSLAMARRRRATPIYRVLVLSPGEG